MNSDTRSDSRLARAIAVTNGKGGVRKTSIVANLATRYAEGDRGYRVLVIDLDPQGNLINHFGLADHPQNNGGLGLVTALVEDQDLPVIHDVRPKVDLIVGGPRLKMLENAATFEEVIEAGGLETLFVQRIAELVDAAGYELVIIDTPPSLGLQQALALHTARYVLIPVGLDQDSWDGVRGIGPLVSRARKNGNPDITYLGFVVTGLDVNAKSYIEDAKDYIESLELDPPIPLFDTFIRYTPTGGRARNFGLLVHELAAKRNEFELARRKALRDYRRGNTDIEVPKPIAMTVHDLADDYFDLAKEVLTKINQHEQAASTAEGE
ncbi:ParA family protein [Jiangella rhizosphaerae]|uniref:ParA family protein n=1 Tax=Jiangella rhizosphaerae TaxID=2293569 RepID=UPI0013150334|nr:ParA family protein [Jiangella rhizosphaerae]